MNWLILNRPICLPSRCSFENIVQKNGKIKILELISGELHNFRFETSDSLRIDDKDLQAYNKARKQETERTGKTPINMITAQKSKKKLKRI